MAKYEKINLGDGQDTNTGDNLYQAFTKVNDAFDEIESDIINIDLSNYYTKNDVDTRVTSLVNSINLRPTTTQVYLKNQTYSKTEVDSLIPNLSTVGQLSDYRTSIGQYTYNEGYYSTTYGAYSLAMGSRSTAMGAQAQANNDNATAIGNATNANGANSVAIGSSIGTRYESQIIIGHQVDSLNAGEIIIGQWNDTNYDLIDEILPTNRLYTIANGTAYDQRSNAYIMFRNGNSLQYGIANYGGDYSATFSDNSLITKKYVDDKIIANVDNAIANVIDGAPDTFDTLREIADWIENDGVDATELAESIALKVDKTEFTTFKTNNTAHINGVYNGLDSRLTILNSTVNDNYSSLSGQIGPIGGRVGTLEYNLTSLTTYVNSFYAKGEIDGMLLGLENRVNNKISSDISTQLNTYVYPRLTSLENKFANYYTISETNNLLENAGVFNKQSNNAIFYKTADMANFRTLGQNSLTIVNEWFGVEPVGAGGANSVAIGYNATAKSDNSIAFGYNTTTFGDNTISFGTNAKTNASHAVAIGANAKANANNSIALGQTTATYSYGLTIGRYNTITATAESGWVAGSPIFQIGNGTSDFVKRDAYVMRNDGSSTQSGIAFYASDLSANYTTRSLIDKGYADLTYATTANLNTQINNAKFIGTYSRRATATSSNSFPTPTQNLMHTYNYGATSFVGGLNSIEGACWFGFYGNLHNFIKVRVEIHLMATEGHSINLGEFTVNCEDLNTLPAGLTYPTIKHQFSYDYFMGAGGNSGWGEVNYIKNNYTYNALGAITHTKTPTTLGVPIYQTFNASSLQLRFYGEPKDGKTWSEAKLQGFQGTRYWIEFK